MTINPKLLQPTILMNTTTPISAGDTINLIDNYRNYKYVEIYFSPNSSTFQCIAKINTSVSRNIIMSGSNYTATGYLQPFSIMGQFSTSGEALTITRFNCVNINTSTFTVGSATIEPRIFRIIGYK